jgi:hypothetical protein
MPVRWQTYPRWQPPSQAVLDIVGVFEVAEPVIGTPVNQKESNEVLAAVAPGLVAIGFQVESQAPNGQKKKVKVPVLFGENGSASKTFAVDAWRDDDGAIIEVEAGSAVDARKFYQDLFEAAVIPGAQLLAVAVMNAYSPARVTRPIDDFTRAKRLLDTVDASAFSFPFQDMLLIGY